MGQRARRLSGYVLLILFVSYYASIAFFTHTHTVNGQQVVHSHLYFPVHDGNQAGHQHSAASLQLIHALSHFFFTGFVLAVSTAVFYRPSCRFPSKRGHAAAVKKGLLRANGLRAPPC